jgi:hypothetical protein
MSSSLITNGPGFATVNDNLTRYVAIAGALRNGTTSTRTTESNAEIPVRFAGTFKNLFVLVGVNTTLVTTTITVRKSAADTAITVSYTSGQTGIKEDNTNSVSYANTDEICYKVAVANDVSGTTTISISNFAIQFEPDARGNTITYLAISGGTNFSTTSATSYFVPNGRLGSAIAESDAVYRARLPFTSSNFYTFVSSNARTTDVVLGTRKNSGAGGQTVTYTSGQTGVKEDTTNSDSIASGDDFNYYLTTSTGTGTITLTIICSTITNTTNTFPLVSGYAGYLTVSENTVLYSAIAGDLSTFASDEASIAVYPRFQFRAHYLESLVQQNITTVASTTVKLRKNQADSGLVLTYTAAQTGLKSDTNYVNIIPGLDDINYEVDNNSVIAFETVDFTFISILGTVSEKSNFFLAI